MLGFVLRHTLQDILGSLDMELNQQFQQLLATLNINMKQIALWESLDGVHRYPYNGKILIEYRLFGYMVSGHPNDNVVAVLIIIK